MLKKAISYIKGGRKFLMNRSLIFLIVPSFIIIFFLFQIFNSPLEKENKNVQELENNLSNIQSFFYNEFNPSTFKIQINPNNGESLQKILYNQKISGNNIGIVLNALRKDSNINSLKTDQTVSVIIKKNKNENIISRLSINLDGVSSVNVFLNTENIYETKRITKILTKQNHYVETTIGRGFYVSGKEANIENNIMLQLGRLYGFEIDFQRDLKDNDKIKVFYERYLDDDGIPQKVGNILFSEIKNANKDIVLYRFEKPKGGFGYYTPEGKSIERSLMRTPINGARLTSKFGWRIHPVLGYNLFHKGTDFAAPVGTPIFASGAGTIEAVGYRNGYGKFISIKHSSAYKTNYGHLSDYAKGIVPGAKVYQGQIIGYVGVTGYATGPHLYYEIEINGKKVNPQTVQLPSTAPLNKNLKNVFDIQKKNIDTLMTAYSAKKDLSLKK